MRLSTFASALAWVYLVDSYSCSFILSACTLWVVGIVLLIGMQQVISFFTFIALGGFFLSVYIMSWRENLVIQIVSIQLSIESSRDIF